MLAEPRYDPDIKTLIELLLTISQEFTYIRNLTASIRRFVTLFHINPRFIFQMAKFAAVIFQTFESSAETFNQFENAADFENATNQISQFIEETKL